MLPQILRIVNRFWKNGNDLYNQSTIVRIVSHVAFGLVAGFARADMLSQEKVDILRKGAVRFLSVKANLFDDILVQRNADFLFQRSHLLSPHRI